MKNLMLKLAVRLVTGLALVMLAGLLGAGCQTTPEETAKFPPVPPEVAKTSTTSTNENPALIATPDLGSARFVVSDLVRVIFSGTIDSIQPHEERIKEDGTITLPLIGPVQAAGKTPGELQNAITKAYVPDYYKRLTVTVSSAGRVYHVGGQVRQPGRQEYLGTTTVTKAIQSAGDFTDYANRKNVSLTRADGKTLTVNCIKAAKNPALDLPVFPGDKIEVPLRGIW